MSAAKAVSAVVPVACANFNQYKDFDKIVKDALNDDFESKYSLKVNSEAPKGISVTTTTECSAGSSAFPTKIALKYERDGFALDKLELTGFQKGTVETSFSKIPNAPGLKLTFKGVDTTAGTLGAVYKHQYATVAADLDVVNFTNVNASVLGGAKGLLVGGSASFALGNNFEVKDFGGGVGYVPKPGIFLGVRSASKCTEVKGAFQYQIQPGLTASAMIDYFPKAATHGATAGVSYKCCDHVITKVRVNDVGGVSLSVKRSIDKFSCVGNVTVDLKHPEAYALGVTATLG